VRRGGRRDVALDRGAHRCRAEQQVGAAAHRHEGEQHVLVKEPPVRFGPDLLPAPVLHLHDAALFEGAHRLTCDAAAHSVSRRQLDLARKRIAGVEPVLGEILQHRADHRAMQASGHGVIESSRTDRVKSRTVFVTR
jgi:hypothetical protein